MCQVEAFTKDTSVRICETNQPDRLNEACFTTVLPATGADPFILLWRSVLQLHAAQHTAACPSLPDNETKIGLVWGNCSSMDYLNCQL